ncbi:SDR family NAD(P)-dependent oxidoreductase [Streptomyces sp. MMG1121]|uniref:SDR family NAD(P)-dependent oxidoreductase n=1 Tax=Streptomyces sp. MMG1121 TaxID=1415544 RepID=UPI00099B5E0C
MTSLRVTIRGDRRGRSGGGSIVNVASVTGLSGFPGVSGYGASKGGVRGHGSSRPKAAPQPLHSGRFQRVPRAWRAYWMLDSASRAEAVNLSS